MKGTNKPKEYTETQLIHFDNHGGLSQSEDNTFMVTSLLCVHVYFSFDWITIKGKPGKVKR